MANADAGESSKTNKSNYDIFLSFRGEDTRHTFTGYLYEALCRKGIKTFMDNENLRIGDSIGPNLLKAIEHSRISIVVFSENYAASKWCLDELVKILECRNEKNMLLFPIFYKVAPSDVRYQRNSYEKAMAAHELRYGCGSEKVKKWRSALFDVSQISGHVLREGYEYKFIQDIVCKADAKLLSSKQLHFDEDMVGLQFRVEEVKSLLDLKSSDSTSMVGIYGIGGIGKTTLAKALYNTICNQFEGACFLFDVRKTSNQEKGQVHLQQTLLLELVKWRPPPENWLKANVDAAFKKDTGTGAIAEKGITWTPRNGNRLAHAAAKAAEAETLRVSWSIKPPGNETGKSGFHPDRQ